MSQIYFTADLHFGHSNILKHSPKRPFSDTVDIVAHDEWLLDLWKSTVDKRDTVYILHFLTLEDIYNAATEKIRQYDCNTFAEYAQNNYRSDAR